MPATPSLVDLLDLSVSELSRMVEAQALPPVECWNPPHNGHSNMRIARDGTWYHEGSPIRRPELVRLFSRILRREPDGRTVLVTPAELVDIDVVDAPFVAVEVKTEGTGSSRMLGFRLSSGDPLVAGLDNPLRVDRTEAGPRPAILVRRGLEALVARPVYYELAQLALEEGHEPAGLWSNGAFFPLDEQG